MKITRTRECNIQNSYFDDGRKYYRNVSQLTYYETVPLLNNRTQMTERAETNKKHSHINKSHLNLKAI